MPLFSMLSIYTMLLLSPEAEKTGYPATVCPWRIAGPACLIRSNCYIVLAAMACVLVVKAIGDKKIRHVLALFCCIAVYFVGHMGSD